MQLKQDISSLGVDILGILLIYFRSDYYCFLYTKAFTIMENTSVDRITAKVNAKYTKWYLNRIFKIIIIPKVSVKITFVLKYTF